MPLFGFDFSHERNSISGSHDFRGRSWSGIQIKAHDSAPNMGTKFDGKAVHPQDLKQGLDKTLKQTTATVIPAPIRTHGVPKAPSRHLPCRLGCLPFLAEQCCLSWTLMFDLLGSLVPQPQRHSYSTRWKPAIVSGW